MIIQAKQAFKIDNPKLGKLEMKYLEIRSGVDENWKTDGFFKALLNDGLITYYEDDKSNTVEQADAESKKAQVSKEERTELDRLIDEAKAKAAFDAGEVSKTQGYDKVKSEKTLKRYTEKYVAQAKEDYEKSKQAEATE